MKKINAFIPLFLSVCIITPFANDIFVPSLPAISQYFQTDKAQLLVSAFMFGLAISQLVYGPCSDRYGRKPVLIIGLTIFIFSSVLAVTAKSFDILLIARFLQAVGACCTIPSAMAIVRDVYPHEKLLKVISYLMGAVILAPIVAPILGSYIAAHFSWRANFYFLLGLGIVYWLLIVIFFRETLQKRNLNALNFSHLFDVYKLLLCHRNYVGFLITIAATYGGIFAYLTVAPYLLIKNLHIPVADYGWYFASFAVMIFIMAYTVPQLGKKIELHFLLLIGIILFVISGIVMLVLNLVFPQNVWLIIAPMMLSGLGIGMIRPAGTTAIMKIIPANYTGISNSLLNTILFLFGTLCTATIAWIPDTIVPFSIFYTSLGILGLIASLFTLKIANPINL